METFNPNATPNMDNFKYKIICYRGDQSACWYYRIHLPMSFMTKEHHEYFVSVTGYIESGHIGAYDMAILQRQYRFEVLEPVLRMKQAGMKLVYEIDDDLFNVPKWNIAHSTYNNNQAKTGIKKFLELMDAVFVTTEELKEVYQKYCENVYILPNSVALDAFTPPPENSTRKVLLWQGSNTHKKDIKILEPSIKRIIEDEDVYVKMWGMTMPNTYHVPGVEFKSFYQMLSQMDAKVGLAPLVPHQFNRSKSNLKFLEYAAQGIATVASDFGPYANSIEHEETGLLISDNRDWYDAIRTLIDDDEYRETLVANAQEYVKEHYDLSKNYIYWKEAIDEIIGEKKNEPDHGILSRK